MAASVGLVNWNACSLKSKIIELKDFLEEKEIDVAFITETHLKAEVNVNIQDFRIVRLDRPTRGGGVAIALRYNINCRLLPAQCHRGHRCRNHHFGRHNRAHRGVLSNASQSRRWIIGCPLEGHRQAYAEARSVYHCRRPQCQTSSLGQQSRQSKRHHLEQRLVGRALHDLEPGFPHSAESVRCPRNPRPLHNKPE
ncbi:uncharacterized protein LOC134226861 [Armigeres subalbatus]|uniref:uncharacterized protein LOC134226861 n=1 Tax=Armigeres subalbatus TaxID=124917 RepID=UPI002ED1A9B2